MNLSEAIKIFEDGLKMREQIPLLVPAFETAISAMQELDGYESKLRELYGECDGMIETVVNSLIKYNETLRTLGMETPVKARLLTDEDVDLWEAYKKLGTLEEVRESMQELQMYKDSKLCLIPEDVYGKQCDELDGYKKLGTLEEVRDVVKFKEYFDELYGKGLEVANWHLNGDLEPFDNFYDRAIDWSDENDL